MYALVELEKLYPKDLGESKVLLIHAGGFSKRLPNVSVTGKIFAVLPFGDPIFTMLEMKLASYIEFPARMSPGVSFFPCHALLCYRVPWFVTLVHLPREKVGSSADVHRYALNDDRVMVCRSL